MIPLQGLKGLQTALSESHSNPGSAERAICCSESMFFGPTASQFPNFCMLRCFEGPLRPGSLCELACSNIASWHFATPNMSYMSASSKVCVSCPMRHAPQGAFAGSLVAGAPSNLERRYARVSCPLSCGQGALAVPRSARWPRRM